MATRFAGVQMHNYLTGTVGADEIGAAGIQGRGMENQTAMMSDAFVTNAGMKAKGAIKIAGFNADAIKAEGAAQGQQAVASGIGSMVSGIAGGFGSMGGGGSSSFGGFSPGTTAAGAFSIGSY